MTAFAGSSALHPRVLIATTARVLRQLRHDPRTIALLVVVPTMLMGLLAWVLVDVPGAFDDWGASLLGVFPLIVMFLVTSVATLRERTSGTLERLMAMPLAKLDFLLGYGLAFGTAAAIQAGVVSAFTFTVFGLDVAGPVWAVLLVAVLDAVLGMALGLFVSAFATTEFQAVQFMPAIILPQLVLCGLIAPRSSLPAPLEAVSAVLPLSYAVDAMQRLTREPGVGSTTRWDIVVIVAFIVGSLVLGATTLRRRTP